MKIISQINDEVIKKAASLVAEHAQDSIFLLRLMHHGSFNHTKESGEEISRKIATCKNVFYIVPYTHWNPFSKTLGHFEFPNYIVNMRKVNALTLKERTANIFHECLGHGLGYSHKGNYVTAYNLETFPYKGSQIFVEYLTDIGAI